MDELDKLRKEISNFEKKQRLYIETELAGKIGGWTFDPITLKQSWTDEIFRILEMDMENGAPEVPKGIEFIDPEYRHLAQNAIQQAIEHGEPYEQEWIVNTERGNKKWVKAVCNPRTKNGKTDSISGSFQDITSNKIVEEELKKSEEKLKIVIDNSPFPIAVVDEEDSRIQFWSKSAKQLFGHNPKTSEEWYELAYPNPEYRQEVIERWKRILENNQNSTKAINTGEYIIGCKNGTQKICEIYAQFIPGSLIITLNDITESKIAADQIKAQNQQLAANEQQLKAANQQLQANEQQLRAANQQLQANEQQLKSTNQQLIVSSKSLKETNKNLKESEERYRSLFNSMQEGFYLHRLVYDDKGNAINYRIIETNDNSEKHLKIKKKDAIGKLATDLFGTQEAPFLEEYSKVAETGEPYSFEQYFAPMEKHFSISVFSPKKGDFATVFSDITARKQAEEELSKYQIQLEELVKERTAEVELKNAKLEDQMRIFVGRELRIKSLEEKVRKLEKEIIQNSTNN